jgi:hypothetical protein
MKILADILPDYGVTKEEVREVVNKLDDIAARISDKEIKFKRQPPPPNPTAPRERRIWQR